MFPSTLQLLFNLVDSFHSSNTDMVDLSVTDLSNLVFASISKDHPFYEGVLSTLSTLDTSDAATKTLVASLARKERYKQVMLAAYDLTEGKGTEADLEALVSLLNNGEGTDKAEEDEFVTDDIELIVNRAFANPGLRWRLNAMNRMLGSLRKGDFGFVFARPETGKTTFLTSEITFMAEQLKEEDGPILWFANEEDGDKVKLRVYQSTFGIDLVTLTSDLSNWKDKYLNLTKGKLKLRKDNTVSKQDIEKFCKKYSPSLIIIDQLSKVRGFEEDRKDLQLGAACRWARDLAGRYAPVIAVHQADGTAEGQKWLHMGHVADAKTAMQAEADWILGIGKSNDQGYEALRFLALSKNKLTGDQGVTDPTLRHGKIECLIDPGVGRYRDL